MKNTLKHKAGRETIKLLLNTGMKQLGKDRQETYIKLYDHLDHYLEDSDVTLDREKFHEVLSDPNSSVVRYMNRIFDGLDKNVVQKLVLNLGYEAMMCGTREIEANRKKFNCNVPWLILMDPTSACNLHCTGCWAAEYGNRLNITLDEMSNVVSQGRDLGVYLYMFTGGEPLVRKADIIELCRKYPDCVFLAFTNGTLVDEAFCEELKKVGNLYLAISLEGSEDVNDLRRGTGVYQKVMRAMELLQKNKLLFGTSICYTSKNYEAVTSPEFIQMIVDKGCYFSMYFHYMPVGNDADVSLLLSPEQRKYMIKRVREIRGMKDGEGIFAFDFQNDGEFVGGCIAGGRNYFHINANGDAEPCVFIHYSDSNIREKTILEILQSPLFMEYRAGQPFNENHLRPCPMLENPEKLRAMIAKTGAKSTDLQSPESVDHLCDKCLEYAGNWAVEADKLWKDK